MRRTCVATLALMVALLQGAPAAGAEEAVVAPPSIESLLTAFDDGGACTGVPDTLPGIFDFTEACEEHDVCYAAGGDRLACDLEFREDLIEACAAQHPEAFAVGRIGCLVFAELYFLGVRLFGGFFF